VLHHHLTCLVQALPHCSHQEQRAARAAPVPTQATDQQSTKTTTTRFTLSQQLTLALDTRMERITRTQQHATQPTCSNLTPWTSISRVAPAHQHAPAKPHGAAQNLSIRTSRCFKSAQLQYPNHHQLTALVSCTHAHPNSQLTLLPAQLLPVWHDMNTPLHALSRSNSQSPLPFPCLEDMAAGSS